MSKCLSCLKECKSVCCRGFFISVKNNSDMRRYYLLHGGRWDSKRGMVWMPMKCAMLDDETLKCKIYFRNRPKICVTDAYYGKDCPFWHEPALKEEK